MLEKEFDYYIKNQDNLVNDYNRKFIVIKNEKVLCAYDSEATAYFETMKTEEEGTFLIQFCEPGTGSYTQIFHSRVAFA